MQETVDAHRRADRAPACRSARSSSTWCGARRCAATDLRPLAKGTRRRRPRWPGRAGGGRAAAPTRARSTALLDEAAELAARVALEKRERRPVAGAGPADRTSCRCCPTASTSAGCTSSPTQLVDAGRGVTTQDPQAAPPRLRRTRLDVDALLGDPATRIVVCCGSGGVGKTTTAAALALRAAEQRAHGRACSPSTRPGGSPSRWGWTSSDNTPGR